MNLNTYRLQFRKVSLFKSFVLLIINFDWDVFQRSGRHTWRRVGIFAILTETIVGGGPLDYFGDDFVLVELYRLLHQTRRRRVSISVMHLDLHHIVVHRSFNERADESEGREFLVRD